MNQTFQMCKHNLNFETILSNQKEALRKEHSFNLEGMVVKHLVSELIVH